MKQATLCYPVINTAKTESQPTGQILLGLKKEGLGAGKFNGFGGKQKEKETLEQAALRELKEEACLEAKPESLEKLGEIDYFFSTEKAKGWNQTVHVFALRDWLGEPMETKEMKPEWFDFGKIPFGQMWQNDRQWLPLVLAGKRFKAKVIFAEDNESTKELRIEEL